MTTPPSALTRLEKAAADNGFDRELPRVGEWLAFASSHAPITAWLRTIGDGHLVVALSRTDVVRALSDNGEQSSAQLPPGAAACLDARTIPKLNELLRRAYQLARSLPNELLHVFEQKTASMPRTTEAERLVVQRVGQDVFREGLMEYWDGKCAMTGLAVPELLRASHIKPWSACESDRERLDVFNGLLLAAHLDAAFDAGLVTVADGGEVLVSRVVPPEARMILGLQRSMSIPHLSVSQRSYLAWHRERVFGRRAR